MTNSSPMLARVLKAAVLRGASDVHAKAGDVFRARVEGELVPLTKQRLTPQQTRALAAMFAGMSSEDPRLETLRDFDCSWGVPGVGRFRINVLRQRSSFMMVLRVIPFSVPTPEGLGLPDIVTHLAETPSGLLLVTGAGGSGKTSTIAAMVHHINRSQKRHIVTLEDPIEFLHRDLSSSISQREIGTDTDDVATGLQAARRQDSDVIVLSDLREAMAIDRAIRASESSALVLASVTAFDCVAAILQMIATLLPDEREVGRTRLAEVLRGMVAQRLVPKGKGGGRKVVIEWFEMTPAIREAITAGADAPTLRKAIEKAAKDGKAELFPRGPDAVREPG
ncbi:MAG TPA: ATPase, T2SS/T4P/T4SS family [Gemmatimonadales bacterium]|jgi:twitching motility protein PilT